MGTAKEYADLVGRHALVGISYVDPDGTVMGLEQIHGTIISVADDGIALRVAAKVGTWLRWLPPAPEAFDPAAPGDYHLRSTGEVVTDPEVIAQFSVVVSDDARFRATGPSADPRPFSRPHGDNPERE